MFSVCCQGLEKMHRFNSAHDNNCRFMINLFDFFEEYRLLSSEEIALRLAARDALALLVRQRAAFWRQQGNSV
jgi:hypothetical protein